MVEPIKKLSDVVKIKKQLMLKPNYYLLFTIGMNSSLKVKTLLNLKREHLLNTQSGETLYLDNYHEDNSDFLIFNDSIEKAFEHYLKYVGDGKEYLFSKKNDNMPIKSEYLSYLIKSWCMQCGIVGQFGGQTLRKTWGYMQVMHFKIDISIISKCYNHACPAITRKYLGLPRNI